MRIDAKIKRELVRTGFVLRNLGTWGANADHCATAAANGYKGGFDNFILLSHGFTLNKNS